MPRTDVLGELTSLMHPQYHATALSDLSRCRINITAHNRTDASGPDTMFWQSGLQQSFCHWRSTNVANADCQDTLHQD